MDCDFTAHSSNRLHFIFGWDAYKQPPNCIIFFKNFLGDPPSTRGHLSCSLPLDGFAISSTPHSRVAVPATFISRPATSNFGENTVIIMILKISFEAEIFSLMEISLIPLYTFVFSSPARSA